MPNQQPTPSKIFLKVNAKALYKVMPTLLKCLNAFFYLKSKVKERKQECRITVWKPSPGEHGSTKVQNPKVMF